MKRPYIPLLAFLLLLLVTVPFLLDFSIVAAPGWHTTILSSNFIWGLLLILILLFATIGFWLFSMPVGKTDWVLFGAHFFLTILTLIFLKFPPLLMNIDVENQGKLIDTVDFQMKLIPLATALFIASQILFFIYFFRAARAKWRQITPY